VLALGLVLGAFPAHADASRALCELHLHQGKVRLDERTLDIELARSRSEAAEAIFKLVDQLWANDAVKRIVYVAAKHDRDVGQLELKRRELLSIRQEAEVEYHASLCDADVASEVRGRARARYEQADCHRIGKELAIAELGLAYHNELLASVLDLRENAVGTAQDVIRARRDVEFASHRVEHHARRVEACTQSGASAGP